MRRLQKQEPSKIPQQSDIVIDPQGRVHVSFFWEDLESLGGLATAETVSSEFQHSFARPTNLAELRKLNQVQLEYRVCRLCPKKCGFNRLDHVHPRCGDWQFRVSTAGLSLGDEPIISGKRGSGTVLLGGCPLKCPSCHNPEMVAGGNPISLEEFFHLAWDLMEQGAHNLQILSPTVHIPALALVLHELKKAKYPIPIIFKSSGFEAIDQLERFSGLVDVYLPDFKFGSCSVWANKAGVRNYFQNASEAIREMINQAGKTLIGPDGTVHKGVVIRHVRAPLPIDETTQIESALAGFAELGAYVSILDNFVSLE